MRGRRIILVSAIVLASMTGALKAGTGPDQQAQDLKQRQGEQRKQLKEQQRSMKAVMDQHPTTAQERKRFNNDMKMQRQMLKNSQKAERRTAEENQRFAKQAHSSSQTAVP
jgi:hypothetical protein